MAKTRSPKIQDSLQAAAQILVSKGPDSLIYNNQTIDYIVNSSSGDDSLAWFYYRKIPELKFICRYVANVLSISRLYAAEVNPNGGEPVRLPDGHPAVELMNQFAGGFVGQSELLDKLGLLLTIVGDSILVGPINEISVEEPFDQWQVYSNQEVSARSGYIYIKFPMNSKEVFVPDGAVAIRIWRSDPQLRWEADSPVKGCIPVLEELHLLSQHIKASAISRLAGAGLLGIPEELDLPTGDMEIEGTEVDRFVALLTEVMGLAIKNRESAAAMVPIILRGPAEYIDKIHHFDFSTPFSESVPELRLGAIRRLALGMDVPPEILLGSAESTSWSAWQVSESVLRVHIIPMLQLITNSLTVGWLRPAMEQLPLTDAQIEQIPNLVVHYDVSNLKVRQDISGDAQALYDRFEIDADSLRQATGYNADTAPDKTELAKQILLSLVRGNPDLALYAINALREKFGIDLPEPPDMATPGPGAPKEIPAPVTAPIKGPVPGKRSQAKQVSPPPVPKADGDQSNNQVA